MTSMPVTLTTRIIEMMLHSIILVIMQKKKKKKKKKMKVQNISL